MKVSITTLRSPGHGLLVLAMVIALAACTQAPVQNGSRAQATVEPLEWSDWIHEPNSDFECPSDQFLIGREHFGSEDDYTSYKCGRAVQFEAIPIKNVTRLGGFEESAGIRFVCPENQVMTGRKHDSDENGETWYYCGTPYDYWEKPMQVVPERKWLRIENEEERHWVVCPADMAMVGRWHEGDETKPTEYLCARLF